MRLPRPLRSNESPSPVRMPLGVNIALVLLVAIASAAAIGFGLWWGIGKPPIMNNRPWGARESFDFVKIVLTVVGGIGGVVALVVSYRKQRLGESAEKRNEAAERREDERLFAENFTRATEQLGSEKAPVRLAGMYALERLANNTPEQQQTITNVLCAYLRMPYETPVYSPDTGGSADHAVDGRPSGEVEGDKGVAEENPQKVDEHREQERQVRLTAQRILARHLYVGPRSKPTTEVFWKNINLDLTGATLFDLDLSMCEMHSARFDGAQFIGRTNFWSTKIGLAAFEDARFGESATFDRVNFRLARFNDAHFSGFAGFLKAQFKGSVHFERVHFGSVALFADARLGEDAKFSQVLFTAAEFNESQFGAECDFSGARFYLANFNDARFSGDASFDETQFIWDANFQGAHFGGHVKFHEARARMNFDGRVTRNWPLDYEVALAATPEGDGAPRGEGQWGYLRRVSQRPDKQAPGQQSE